MIQAKWKKYVLNFKEPAGTSRGIIYSKTSYFIFLTNSSDPIICGIGECGVLAGLSADDKPEYEKVLSNTCNKINENSLVETVLIEWPSIRFGYEMALLDLKNKGKRILFPSDFTNNNSPIKINGLVWMGNFENMKLQIENKINAGFKCVKLKIGAIQFEDELELLKKIRKEFAVNDIEIRLDANGAFNINEALQKIELLSKFNIHSIEQPIKQMQVKQMALLCKNSPIDIALDEELIGINKKATKIKLLEEIKPAHIILKPSFLGGYAACNEWIEIANQLNIGWWVTSALESNIGLSAIAQWVYTLQTNNYQGLGTGQLYTNNFLSPLKIEMGNLYFDQNIKWDTNNLINDE
jgi:o-succinylbenzoate synthase